MSTNHPNTKTTTQTPSGDGVGDAATTQRNKGLGRIIVAVYGIFALAATARALFQILTKFSDAPLAFTLSGAAAVVYVIATLCLAIPGTTTWRIAMIAVIFELVGVIGIGIFSLVSPELFPESTVWSNFGQGYGYVPLVLPFIGLWWLLKHRPNSGVKHG